MSDVVKRTIRTFLQVFVGLFLVDLLGFLDMVQDWALCVGTENCTFPDVTVLAQAAIAAASAGVVAVVTFLQNLLEDIGLLPSVGKTPNGLSIKPTELLVTTSQPMGDYLDSEHDRHDPYPTGL